MYKLLSKIIVMMQQNMLSYFFEKLEEANIKLPKSKQEWIVVEFKNEKAKYIKSVKFNSNNQIILKNYNIKLKKLPFYDEVEEKEYFEIETSTIDGISSRHYFDVFDLWIDERIIWV